MLTLQRVDMADLVGVLGDIAQVAGSKPADWAAFWKRRGLVAFAASLGETVAGLAIAESTPRQLHITYLEGSKAACRRLLHRLVMLAGERPVSVSCSATRMDLRQMLEQTGFDLLLQKTVQGQPVCLYACERKDELEEK